MAQQQNLFDRLIPASAMTVLKATAKKSNAAASAAGRSLATLKSHASKAGKRLNKFRWPK
jgi:hypothetical protein